MLSNGRGEGASGNIKPSRGGLHNATLLLQPRVNASSRTPLLTRIRLALLLRRFRHRCGVTLCTVPASRMIVKQADVALMAEMGIN